MARLLTRHIATMTELREPHKVLERSGGQPVAILKNSKCVGYLVPQEWVDEHGIETEEALITKTREAVFGATT